MANETDDEDERMRSATLQNARSILAARRRAEEALRKQSEWLRVTLASIGDAVISTDAEGRVSFMNGVAETLTGWRQAEALGRPLSDVFQIVNERNRQPVANPALRALHEGIIVGLANHTILISRDGTERPIDDSAAPIRNDQGEVAGVVLVFRDIAGRKAQEALLLQSEERATAIVESIADGLITLDKEWRVTYLNPRGEEMLRALHKTDEGIRGRNFWEEFPEVVGTYREEGYRRAMRDRVPVQHEVFYPALAIWLDVRTYPSRDGLSLYFLDITERKLAEINLRNREQQFAALAESIPQLAFMGDPDGHIFWYNRRWYDHTGTNLELMQGWGWQTVHDPDVLPTVMEKWKNSIVTGEPFEMVFPLRGANGQFRSFLTRVVPVKNEDGQVTRWFGTSTDVTEQRKMANELRQLAADLSEADRRKNEFLAMLAHELRNPLAPIRNALQIVQLSAGDKHAVLSASELMERQIKHMVQLVDDLLDVSRITRGKLDLRTERVELATIIAHAVETSRPAIESARHALSVTLPQPPVHLHADPVRLAQVFSNLLNNASKYSEPGGRIELTATLDGTEVLISVKDTGVGIPAEMLPRIFEMFTQVDRSLERSQGGLGIGLTLVQRLVELHRGSVQAHSAGNGRGSEFVVRLPVLPEQPRASTSSAGTQPREASHARRILVVDDNRDSATTLAMLLKMKGHETLTAHDGLEALEKAEAFRPDVVFLDIGLPRLNGYEVARKIRDEPWGNTMVLVALTGWGQDEDRRKSKEAGFNEHLVKPVDYAALMKLLAGMQTA